MFLQEIQQIGTIREFLFEVNKDGNIYWVCEAVPQGTTDFSKVQVFFHPTVKQKGVVHAEEADYPAFRGGWSGKLQRYVEMQGAQLAGARQTTLLVPFMTMASLGGKAPAYMFAVNATETLEAIIKTLEQMLEREKEPIKGPELHELPLPTYK